MPMLRRCHIYGKKNIEGPEGWEEDDNAPWYDPKGKYGPEIKGAIVNGYTVKEIEDYFELIQNFCSYLFNKSHAVAYSFTSILMAWLKIYYPVQFYSAFLSMQAVEDLLRYIPMIRKEGIDVKVPEINGSDIDFTPNGNSILFGLGSIKGVGDSSIPEIVNNRPYSSLEDIFNKVPKKSFNKRVGEALIKSGAFAIFNTNRYELLDEFHAIRKDKIEELNIGQCDDEAIMQMEMETINCPVTKTPEWYSLDNGEVENVKIKITEIDERKDKGGNIMAFCKGDVGGGATIDLVIFSSIYLSNMSSIRCDHTAYYSGKKESDSKIIIKKVSMVK